MHHGADPWFNDGIGFGFIEQVDGADVVVHFSGITGDEFKSLTEGNRVYFVTTMGPRGLQAANITRI